jgi:hypothetical protein
VTQLTLILDRDYDGRSPTLEIAMTTKTRTTFDSSPLAVFENGLRIDADGPYGGDTRILFNWPDADQHGDRQNTGEVVIIDTCSEGMPHFAGTYPQAEAIAKLIVASPDMHRALLAVTNLPPAADGSVLVDAKVRAQLVTALNKAGDVEADTIKTGTFICEDETIHRYCRNEADARAMREDIQSINGSSIEQDGEFIYAVVTDVDAAIEELEEAGYEVECR